MSVNFTELAQAVEQHALDNYNRNGWDFIVECWTTNEIIVELAGVRPQITTKHGAIAHMRLIAEAQNERRQEQRAMMDW